MIVQTVDQLDVRLGERLKARLVFRMHQVLRHVVQEESEICDSKLADILQLVRKGLKIRLAGISYGKSWAYREAEVHEVFSCSLLKSAQVFQLLRRIGLAPEFAVIRIILRPVNVEVHSVLPFETQHVQAVGVAPRRSVETFHNAPNGKGWIIGEDNFCAVLLKAYELRSRDEIQRAFRRLDCKEIRNSQQCVVKTNGGNRLNANAIGSRTTRSINT